MTAIIELISLI